MAGGHIGSWRAFHARVIHPFAHMNSNYAAAQVRAQQGGVAAKSSEPFAKLLRSSPAEDVRLPIAGDRAPSEETPPAVEEEASSEPAAPPSRPRSAQADEAPAEPPRRSTVPHFLSVAESLQHPNGPYRQAPAEHGGEWWLTNPFTGTEPWLTQGLLDPYAAPAETADPDLDPGFLAVFGPRPNRETHPNPLLRGAAVADWERNLEHFKGVGAPEGFTQEQVDAAGAVFEAWGLGKPLFYEGRYGWTAMFPSAGGDGFEASPYTTLEAPHLVVARYQVEMAERGGAPAERHPFVPPQVFEIDALTT